MFDIGFTEILLLSLVGLMVLGPERLPRVARTLGGMARKARSSWLNLKRTVEAEIRAEELKEPLRQFEQELKGTADKVKSGIDNIRNFDPLDPDSANKPDHPEPEPKPSPDSESEQADS